MFVPSLVAWLQLIGICQNFPRFWDSLLSTGVILHGTCDSKPELNFFWFPIPGFPLWEIRLSFGYLLAGYFSVISALVLSPYMVFILWLQLELFPSLLESCKEGTYKEW